MPQIIVDVPKLHAGQRKIDNEARRFNVIDCGRRFGKSVLSRRRLLRIAGQGKPVAYFCPTYKMLSEYWRETVAEVFPILDKPNVQEKRLHLISGGTIDMWSLDEPNAARGRKYAHVAIDEAAMIPRLQEAWQEVLRPTLTDFQGSADFYSTPKGRNFFWQLWQRGHDPAQDDWISWQMPTTTNPHIKPEEVEAARKELPERVYFQEYLAEFLEDGGGVFRRVREAATAVPQKAAIPGHQYIGGLDWGQKNDFTVLSVVDVTTGEQATLDRFNQIDYHFQINRVRAVCERFGVSVLIPELNSMGAPLVEMLKRADWIKTVQPFQTTNSTKAAGVQGLQLAFEKDEYKILDPLQCEGELRQLAELQIAELQAYEMEQRSNYTIYGAPEGMHDDIVMGNVFAWWGASAPEPITPQSSTVKKRYFN